VSSVITVAIPSIAPRTTLLARALASVATQNNPAVAVSIAFDTAREGAPATRDRALAGVTTTWVAFLDDDDEMNPEHLQALMMHAETTGADLVYPWYDVVGGMDPFPQWEHDAWCDSAPHQVPVTFLARTDAIRAVGGFSYDWDASQGSDPGVDSGGNRAGEDYRLILRLARGGVKIVHLDQRTWKWHHDSGNTSGLPSRWSAS